MGSHGVVQKGASRIDRTRKGLVDNEESEASESDAVGKKKTKKRGPSGPFPREIRRVIDDIIETLLKRSNVKQEPDNEPNEDIEGDPDFKTNTALGGAWEGLCDMFPNIKTKTFEKVSEVFT